MDQQNESKGRRRELVTEFGTRLAIVKGYVQLLNRHVDRPEIPRAQLARYSVILEEHLALLEDAAKRLVAGTEADAMLDERSVTSRIDTDDTPSSSAS